MTVDVKVHAFAATWLQGAGYTYSWDVQKLAELIQGVCEEFQQELEEQS